MKTRDPNYLKKINIWKSYQGHSDALFGTLWHFQTVDSLKLANANPIFNYGGASKLNPKHDQSITNTKAI